MIDYITLFNHDMTGMTLPATLKTGERRQQTKYKIQNRQND